MYNVGATTFIFTEIIAKIIKNIKIYKFCTFLFSPVWRMRGGEMRFLFAVRKTQKRCKSQPVQNSEQSVISFSRRKHFTF